MAAATALALACGDAASPRNEVVDESDLIPLALQSTAPPIASASFYVRNGTETVRSLRHSDAFNTLYLEVRFPPGSLAALDGVPVGSADSVLVTLDARPGGYGLTLSPVDLALTTADPPTVTFAFARYGDLSVADGEPAFPDRATYAAELAVWEEVAPRRWRLAPGGGVTGVSEISAALVAGGDYLLAARR